MTTRANNAPVIKARCHCGHALFIFQARGKRAYLYARCVLCGFSQRPHDMAEQSRLWNLLPAETRATLKMPRILEVPAHTVCPCCGKTAAAA